MGMVDIFLIQPVKGPCCLFLLLNIFKNSVGLLLVPRSYEIGFAFSSLESVLCNFSYSYLI